MSYAVSLWSVLRVLVGLLVLAPASVRGTAFAYRVIQTNAQVTTGPAFTLSPTEAQLQKPELLTVTFSLTGAYVGKGFRHLTTVWDAQTGEPVWSSANSPLLQCFIPPTMLNTSGCTPVGSTVFGNWTCPGAPTSYSVPYTFTINQRHVDWLPGDYEGDSIVGAGAPVDGWDCHEKGMVPLFEISFTFTILGNGELDTAPRILPRRV